jgi:hypothetical protein
MILVKNLAAEDFEESLTFGNLGLLVLFKL